MKSEITKKVGQNIKNIAKIKGIRLGDLASKMGISQPYLSEILSGKAKLTLEHLNKISEILEVPLSVLIGEASYQVTNGVIAISGGNNVKVSNNQIQIESKTEEGRRWERLFKDCQEKLKSCIEKRKELEEKVKELEAENFKLKGQVELLEKWLEEKEKTIRVLMSKK